MRNLKQFEALATYTDDGIGNNVFGVKYKNLDDLSGHSANRTNSKPTNDMLDEFQEGDIVSGEGIHDEKMHTGPVVSIKKDEKGENVEIHIEEDGSIIELKVTSVKMEEDRGRNSGSTPAAAEFNPAEDPDNMYPPKMMENSSKPSFKNLKSFYDFNGK